MRTQSEVEQLIHRLYKQLGSDAADLIQISPIDGSWKNALSYDVKRKDGKKTKIYRRHIDDRNEHAIATALKDFK